ncbi:hypothetical protein LCGC14_0667050 [marine sediment metagenome]|uniref:Putative regulatory protein FmdB zinc ribbon domain-containing protein n=1 Tax=marine sediment metagenome TaxID=412755 RepID=A0A0F9U049_9ZZZZ
MTYEYICDTCKITKEIRHSMSDDSPRHCNKCKRKLRRLITGGCGFILKGEGFFVNDYKKPKEVKDDCEI